MRFFMTFIDDFTRKCTVKFLRTKGEASNKVKDYVAWVERQTKYVPKRVRAPYSPQQNGVAERFNRTLMELTRAMLEAKSLPKILWAAAQKKHGLAFAKASNTFSPSAVLSGFTTRTGRNQSSMRTQRRKSLRDGCLVPTL